MDEKTAGNDKNFPVSRERLYGEVWSEPITTVAEKYKVSGSFLARICTRLNVPRPPRGYWAMLAAGRKMTQPPLPEVRPGDELEWVRYGHSRVAQLPLPKLPQDIKRRRSRRVLSDRHPLLDGAKELISEGGVSHDGYLKPKKHLLVDVIVSKETLDRALDVANELFMSLEKRGHTVMFEPYGQDLRRHSVDERENGGRQQRYMDLWSPSRCTLVFIGTVAIGLTIYEMSENVEVEYRDGKYTRVSDLPAKKPRRYQSHSWTTTRDLPSGRLCVQAYSPYPRASWMRQLRETKVGDFPRKLKALVRELEAVTPTIVRLVEEGERRAEIERQQQEERQRKWEREEAERKRLKAEEDSRGELSQIIHAWAEAKRIEQFFTDVEAQAGQLSPDKRVTILERLKLAREMIGCTDALQWFTVWETPEERLKQVKTLW